MSTDLVLPVTGAVTLQRRLPINAQHYGDRSPFMAGGTCRSDPAGQRPMITSRGRSRDLAQQSRIASRNVVPDVGLEPIGELVSGTLIEGPRHAVTVRRYRRASR